MERYVNDGSPSGYSWKYNTSPATNPRGSNPSFKPYVASFPARMISDYGEVPGFLRGVDVLLHPDMANLKLITSNCDSLNPWTFPVAPTSSSRTVEILDPGPSGYIKLNYKGMIGRTDRQLTRNHAISAVELTEMMKSAVLMNRLPSMFSFLPEPGARVVLLPDQEHGEYEWGMVIRERDAYPYSNRFAFVIPAFSLFATDKLQPNDPLLLVQLIDLQHLPPDEYLFNSIISPIITCYFDLLTNCALQLECHAQNALIGFDDECRVTGIIVKDLESVDKDISLAEDLHLDVHFKSAPYKCLQRGQYNYTIMHSFMYDFKLGVYLIKPLINVITKHYRVNPKEITSRIKTLARKYMQSLPDTFFPSDGMWYYYEKIVHDRTKPRPYLSKPNPQYR
jgi:siderophore synthetase component